MVILIRKRHVAYLVLLCCFVAGLSAVLWHGNAAFTAAFAPEEGTPFTVVVDAGHGGEDGGAVAGDGTVESGLNLSIARRVRDLLTFAGVSTAVTREGEDAIYDPGSTSLREKKVSDLHNRVDLVNAIPGAVLVSIHQNSLPSSPSTRGAQVFWNRQEGAGGVRPNGTERRHQRRKREEGGPGAVLRVPDEGDHGPRRAGGVRLSLQRRGDGTAEGPGLPDQAGGCHRGRRIDN